MRTETKNEKRNFHMNKIRSTASEKKCISMIIKPIHSKVVKATLVHLTEICPINNSRQEDLTIMLRFIKSEIRSIAHTNFKN